MDRPFLSQEEVDALLGGNVGYSEIAEKMEEISLTAEEQDVLSEIGNINAGSATTALSELLGQRVIIDTPTLTITTVEELHKGFNAPYLFVEVEYTSGMEGNNVFILKSHDAAVIANLMMGGDGLDCGSEMDEMTISAVSEAMNQMIGFSATSMAEMFHRIIDISPPKVRLIGDLEKDVDELGWNFSKNIVSISFSLQIGEVLQSEIMLIISIDVAKQQVHRLLLETAAEVSAVPEEISHYSEPDYVPIVQQEPTIFVDKNPQLNNNNLNLILDIPLRLSVLLGTTKRNIIDVLRLCQGSILELERLENEPVDILLNDTLIARGEVVVVKEYFGVRITDIISAENRIKSLGAH